MGEPLLLQFLLAIFIWNVSCNGQICDLNGVSCINCTDYKKCIGGALLDPIFVCRNGVDCHEQPLLEYCRTKLNCYSLNECTEVGIFPDKTSETKYFVCLPDSGSGLIKYEFICPEGEFFEKTSRICVSSTYTSEKILETSTLSVSVSTSESTVTVPSSSLTPETTNSDSTSASTTESTVTAPSSSLTPETTNSDSTSASTTESTVTAPTSPPTFACRAPGIFPNPTNCKMYFRCSTSLKRYNYSCPGASYFNENLLKCSLNITATCQEEILRNITTSTTSLTSPITTNLISTPQPTRTPLFTTTTTLPSLTQPSTTSTSQAQSTPSCSAAGTFENPLDCKTYYRCSSNGRIFLYVCPAGTYYNKFTKRCGLTITPGCRNKLNGY